MGLYHRGLNLPLTSSGVHDVLSGLAATIGQSLPVATFVVSDALLVTWPGIMAERLLISRGNAKIDVGVQEFILLVANKMTTMIAIVPNTFLERFIVFSASYLQ
jgi:hypothetical protein